MGLGKKKKGGAAEGDAEPKDKKGKSNLVPAIIVAVGLIGPAARRNIAIDTPARA